MDIIQDLALTFTLIMFAMLVFDGITGVADTVGGDFKKYYEIVGGSSIVLCAFFWVLYVLGLIWF